MTSPNIAIVGTGHMGGSLIGGLIAKGLSPQQLYACDLNSEKLSQLEAQFGIHVTTETQNVLDKVDVVILAIKPQHFKETLKPLSHALQQKKPLIISVAAGMRIAMIRELVGDLPIVRAMPNTPALIGAGATALYAERLATPLRDLATSILSAVGVVVWVQDEAQMDVITALSGSGPAYFFRFMECLQDAATQLGLPADTARFLTLHTGLGAIKMAIESGEPLSTLRDQVTSPGGTTERALKVLEEGDFKTILQLAVKAAKERSETLALELGEPK